jgi:DNA-directed RNA polymerase specialized sigma24 family protein
LSSLPTLAGRPEYFQQLQAIREDLQVIRLARTRARDPELAEDALQETFYAMARISDPGRIRDLKAYFCRVLIHVINALRGQLGALLPEDFPRVADERLPVASSTASLRSVEESAATNSLAREWLARFSAERTTLCAAVPSRSRDPGRYRELIVSTAEEVVRSIITGDVCDADSPPALRAAYPEWFADNDCSPGNIHQRFSRAHDDIQTLLKMIVKRDDLYS